MENKSIKPTLLGKILVVVVLVILIITCYMVINWCIDKHVYVTTDNAKIGGAVLTVSSRIVGKLASINVKEGDKVKKGEVLYTLEVDMLEAKVKQAKAMLELAQSKLNKTGLIGTTSRLKLASGGASIKDMAILVNTVKAAKASLELAMLTLSFAKVKASGDGTVIQVSSHIGEVVSPSFSVMTIIDLTKLNATAFILEKDIKNVKEGQRVKLTIDAFPRKSFEGKVRRVGLATVSAMRFLRNNNFSGSCTKLKQRIPVTIDFNYTGSSVIPGMEARVKIKISK